MKFLFLIVLTFTTYISVSAQTYGELITKGDELYSAKNYNEAINYFTQAIAKDATLVKGFWFRADSYRALGSYEAAIKDYTSAIAIDAANSKFYKLRGDCYYNLKQYTAAEKDYSKGLELDPKNATLWLFRGDCYLQLKQNDKACPDYKKAHELGARNARIQAGKIACEWLNHIAGNRECPTGEAPISKVEVDPQTGAVFTSKGLTYDKYEIKNEAGAFISGPEIALGETIVLTLFNPKGFCTDTDGVIFIGAGHETREVGGREIDKVHNVYKEGQSFTPDQAKSISIKFKVAAPMTEERSYDMKAHFFDTKGNGEIFVEMPIQTTPKTLTAAKFTTSTGVVGPGMISSAVGGEIKRMELHHKEHGAAIPFNELQPDNSYILTANDVKNLNKHSNFMFRFIDDQGRVAIENIGKAVYHGEHVKLDFSTDGVRAGKYTLWLKIQEDKAPQNIGILVPVEVK